MSLHVVEERRCGDCRACCVVFEIVEVELMKPAREPCPKLCASGCSIYEQRPRTCASFSCLWIAGVGGDEHRPDRCGFVLHEVTHPMGGPLVVATETDAGALADDSAGYRVASEIAYQVPVLINRVDGTRRAIQPAGRFVRPIVADGEPR